MNFQKVGGGGGGDLKKLNLYKNVISPNFENPCKEAEK